MVRTLNGMLISSVELLLWWINRKAFTHSTLGLLKMEFPNMAMEPCFAIGFLLLCVVLRLCLSAYYRCARRDHNTCLSLDAGSICCQLHLLGTFPSVPSCLTGPAIMSLCHTAKCQLIRNGLKDKVQVPKCGMLPALF